jgi:hypothetical protein
MVLITERPPTTRLMMPTPRIATYLNRNERYRKGGGQLRRQRELASRVPERRRGLASARRTVSMLPVDMLASAQITVVLGRQGWQFQEPAHSRVIVTVTDFDKRDTPPRGQPAAGAREPHRP